MATTVNINSSLKVSATDTQPGFLQDKLTLLGPYSSGSISNPGAAEVYDINPWTGGFPREPDLVADWPMHEQFGTRADTLGNYDLTSNGSMFFDDTAPRAEFGQFAAQFNGTDAYLLASGFVLPVTGAVNNFSISFWIKLADVFAGGTVIDMTGLGGPSLKIEQNFFDGLNVTLSSDGIATSTDFSAFFLESGIWAHCVMTVDANTGAVEYYVDGFPNTTGNVVNGIYGQSPGGIAVGSDNLNPGNYSEFSMHELRIWNVVLTPEEIINLYNFGAPIAKDVTDLEPTLLTPNISSNLGPFTNGGPISPASSRFNIVLKGLIDNATAVQVGPGNNGFDNELTTGFFDFDGITPGTDANATGTDSMAIGDEADCSGANSIAFGTNADATHNGGIAIGHDAEVQGATSLTGGIAIGDTSIASASDALAVGRATTASAARSIAIGNNANTRAAINAIAIGYNSIFSVTGMTNSVLIGTGTSGSATANDATFIGPNVGGTGASSVAIGDGSQANGTSNVAIGDTVNGGGTQNAIAIGTTASTGADGCIAIGNTSNATGGGNGVAIGNASNCTGGAGVALGSGAITSAASAVQLGAGTNATTSTLQFLSVAIANGDSIQATTQATGVAPTSTPADGTIVVDENGTGTLWVRVAGTWRSTALV